MIRTIFLFLGCLICVSCIEELPMIDSEFEDLPLVEATLTNEHKQQQISLSRTFGFEGVFRPLQGASVLVRNDAGDRYTFKETEKGIYTSQEEFGIRSDEYYWLELTRADGKQNVSEKEQLPISNVLDSISVKRIVNDHGEDGMAIMTHSFNEDGPLKNYRYVYEETYKVVAPKWTPKTLVPFESEGSL